MINEPPVSTKWLASGALAPMEGVTDFPMRLWMSLAGRPDELTTPFIRVTSTFDGTDHLARSIPEIHLQKASPYSLVPQIMLSDPEHLKAIAPKLIDEFGVLEINAGCPAPKCVSKGAGSRLLVDPTEFQRFLEKITAIVPRDLTRVKMRTGFDGDEGFWTLVEIIENLSLNRLTIHGRTAKQKYSGFARWDLIHEAKRKIMVPVVGSGDIVSVDAYRQRMTRSSNVPVLIGRGALRNPWIFQEMRCGMPMTVPLRTILESMEVLFLFYNLWQGQQEVLLDCVKQGLFRSCAGIDPDRWTTIKSILVLATKGKEHPEIGERNKKRSLAKIKLLWNYLRSSLPAPFFSPKVLRSTHFNEFISELLSISENHGSDTFRLSHQPKYDWVYTSDKKDPRTQTQE